MCCRVIIKRNPLTVTNKSLTSRNHAEIKCSADIVESLLRKVSVEYCTVFVHVNDGP